MAKADSPNDSSPNLPAVDAPAIPPHIAPPSSIQRTRTISRASKALASPFKKPSPKFDKFMTLPTEVRLQIWEAAIIPRVHELHPCAKLHDNRMTFRSNASLTPSIFHACTESREVALQHYKLMEYEPPRTGSSGKGILRFYFAPKYDTLLLNSLMGLFIMFMLLELEDEDNFLGVGVMPHWESVAFDAERAQLITLLSGLPNHAPSPRFKAVFPSLRSLTIAFDYKSNGKTRFRTSVWPGENGTTLKYLKGLPVWDGGIFETVFSPMKEYLENDFGGDGPEIRVAKVKRKRFVRGDLRYALRWSCSLVGLRPRGILRRV